MKIYFFIVLSLLAISNTVKGQTIDSASYGNENFRAVMGGGERVNHDTKTPLIKLIQKLEEPWELVPTFKAYWIGYTDNMYSIADYKNEAIPFLVKFIDTATNNKARIGGLYALHLIGIDEKVEGRFSENFVRKNARVAIIRYLNDRSLNETVIFLLMRDPWLSDIPQLMDYLSQHNKNYSKVLSALQRYDFGNKPVAQEIDPDLLSKKITILHTDSNPPSSRYSIDKLIAYQKEFGQRFFVDREIEESPEWQESKDRLSKMKNYKRFEDFEFGFSFAVGDVFNFCNFQESFFYTFGDHKLNLYGPIKTREIWLDWWNKLADKNKTVFYSYVHPSFAERYKNK